MYHVWSTEGVADNGWSNGYVWRCKTCGVEARGPFNVNDEKDMKGWYSTHENRHVSKDCNEEIVKHVLKV